MSSVVRSCGSASTLLPCVGIGPPWRVSSVPAVLLAFYCRAVDNGPPWRLSFVPAVLLALYCRAVDNGPPWRVSSVPAVLLALYRPALILFRRGVYSPPWVSASSLLPCGGNWFAVASIVRLWFPAGVLLPCG